MASVFALQVREDLLDHHRVLGGYYGAALATDGAGDRRKVADYYAKLIVLGKKADSQRPELARARAYVAQR